MPQHGSSAKLGSREDAIGIQSISSFLNVLEQREGDGLCAGQVKNLAGCPRQRAAGQRPGAKVQACCQQGHQHLSDWRGVWRGQKGVCKRARQP